HCVLEVRRKRPVRCADRPPVRFDVHIRRTLVDHRLDRESHPGLQLRSSARHTEVRELRGLVHRAPASMPAGLPDDSEAGPLCRPSTRGGYTTEVPAGLSVLDGDLQTLLCDTRQPPRLRAHLAYRDSAAHVGPKPIQNQAQIEADYVAVLDLSLARNAVDGL